MKLDELIGTLQEIQKDANYQDIDVGCPVCHGKGFNKNKLKPKMVQQGWEE